MVKPRVLFLCTGNSARSQMAEGILRSFAGDRFEVLSAGIDPKGVNPLAIQAMREDGIDISGHRSKHVTEFLGQPMQYVITVCDGAQEKCPIFPGAYKFLSWSFDDPAAAQGSDADKLTVFRRVRDEIGQHIQQEFAVKGHA